MIICIVGRLRSGKSVVTKAIAEATNCPIVEVGNIVKRIAGEDVNTKSPAIREKLQLEKDKHKDNKDWLYSEIKKEIKKLLWDDPEAITFDRTAPLLSVLEKTVVVSGIREVYLLEQLEKDCGKVLVIGLMVRDETRMKRVAEVDHQLIEQFLKDEERDIKIGILEVMKKVDFWIDTERPIKEIQKSIQTLFKSI